MIGLVKKDLFLLRRVYMKNFFLVLALYTALGIALKMTSFFTLMSWMYGFYVLSLFSVDNACRWDFYAATLPVSRRAVVTAKFLLLGLCVAAGQVYSLVMAPVAYLVVGVPLMESVLTSLLATLVLVVYFAVMLPLTYAFGPDKARSAMLLALVVVGGGIFAAASLGDAGGLLTAMFGWMETSLVPGIGVLAGAAAAVCLVCWLASCRIYEKKEF
ncbi:MAG TPA: ABC-2 transporter permease [Candidatus Fournierella excrementigallinarum]|nr:ABC-2 transporter permease [Candidatus Fournierella excrementigallinarum]